MFVILYSKFSDKCSQLISSISSNDQIIKLCVDNKKIRKYVREYISGVPCMFVLNDQNSYRYDGIYDIMNFLNSMQQQQEQELLASVEPEFEFTEPMTLESEILTSGRGPKVLDIAQQMAAEREMDFSETNRQ